MATTKVICANCGAEIVIPEKEVKGVVGTAIGKDSGLGTVILPTEKNAMDKDEAIAQLKKLGDLNPCMQQMVDAIMGQIHDSGYLEVNKIVRRWIPSQCLRMQFSKGGLHKALLSKGYDYSWKVALNELSYQVKCVDAKDMEAFHERHRWYNETVFIDMAHQYVKELERFMKMSKIHKHGRRKYIRLTCDLNKGMGVYLSEFDKVLAPLYEMEQNMAKAPNINIFYLAFNSFNKLRKKINYKPERPSEYFINAYKAAGAYYTVKDLIMYEGCRCKKSIWKKNSMENITLSLQESLDCLEDKAKQVMRTSVYGDNVCYNGYIMLGYLREFLHYNKFNFEETKKKWMSQHEARMAGRGKKIRRY